MKPLIAIMIAVVAGLHAEDTPQSTLLEAPERNAALQYWIAFALLPKETPIAWLNAMRNTTLVDDQAAQEHSPALQYLLLGASMPSGQFGSEAGNLTFGMTAEMPHVSSASLLGRLASARCLWRIQHKQYRPAIEDAVAIMALGSDIARHSTMIEGLDGLNLQCGALVRLGQCLVECSDSDRDYIRDHVNDARHVLRSEGLFDGENVREQWTMTHPTEALTQLKLAKENQGKNSGSPDMPLDTHLTAYLTASPEDISRWSAEVIKHTQTGFAMLDLPHNRYLIERERYIQISLLLDPHNPQFSKDGSINSLVLILIRRYRANRAAATIIAESAQRLNAHQTMAGMAGFQTLMGPVTVVDASVGNSTLAVDPEESGSGMSIRIGHGPWIAATTKP
jgi:hypothetical protein